MTLTAEGQHCVPQGLHCLNGSSISRVAFLIVLSALFPPGPVDALQQVRQAEMEGEFLESRRQAARFREKNHQVSERAVSE